MILSPSLLSADCGRLAETLQELEAAGVEWVHWDVMDGHFVPNMTFGQHVIKGLRGASGLFFDVHLMIEQPERYLADFKAAGADMLVVHAEATVHLQRTLAEIRRLGMKSGVALNPATPLSVLDYVLDDVDMVLIMSVNPGFGGQKFLPATFRKVAELRAKLDAAGRSDCLIQIDGGVNVENTGELVRAGADVLVSGSAFFGFPPFKERLAAFMAAAEQN
ncbi:ribulose-phosphate 3-epimerase [Mailhella sp.]|uniref:ribulose-phosphate 3-epimerase n=1 Tax=Mailhella sp. TaxID=1981029 RepID=UPI0040636A02